MIIDNITIVGGGSAGWMTATTLLSEFPDKKITLVESPNISNIGVGESTVAGNQSGFTGIRNWLDLVGIHHFDFMSQTDAIFKLSIAFENWYRKDSGTFHYPFGLPRFLPKSERFELNHWHLKKIFYPETPTSDFDGSSGRMELRTGTATPAKADTYQQVTTPVTASRKAIDSNYPKTNDGDSDNTGAGTDIVTWLTSWTTSDFNATSIIGGCIHVGAASPANGTKLLTHFTITSFDKTASDTLKIFVNHTFNGV